MPEQPPGADVVVVELPYMDVVVVDVDVVVELPYMDVVVVGAAVVVELPYMDVVVVDVDVVVELPYMDVVVVGAAVVVGEAVVVTPSPLLKVSPAAMIVLDASIRSSSLIAYLTTLCRCRHSRMCIRQSY